MLFGLFRSKYNEVKEELRSVHIGLRGAFKHIKKEFDDHLNSINQNTSEIQTLYDHLSEIDRKVEKLTERVDELEMYVNPREEAVPSIDLTLREQEVFVTLYAASEKLSLVDVGRRLGFTTEMVNKYAYSMLSKGVPVIIDTKGEEDDEEVLLGVDANFKTMQAKHSIISIDDNIRRQMVSNKYT